MNALAVRLWQWARPQFTVTLIGAWMLTVASYSLIEAKWVGDPTYVFALWWGAACGLVLARTRWALPLAVPYSLLIALVYAAHSAEPLFTADALRTLPIHLWSLGARMNGWITAIATGQPIYDTGFFAAVMAWGLWQTGAWLAWARPAKMR